MPKYEAGMEVRVFGSRGMHHGAPDDGWQGKIISVARVYATAAYTIPNAGFGEATRTVEFSMHDGVERGYQENPSWGRSVMSTADAELRARRKRATSTMKRAGIEFRTARHMDLELAEAIAGAITRHEEGKRS